MKRWLTEKNKNKKPISIYASEEHNCNYWKEENTNT
jgi:hypothetical protein